jgi:hypothetical protein
VTRDAWREALVAQREIEAEYVGSEGVTRSPWNKDRKEEKDIKDPLENGSRS